MALRRSDVGTDGSCTPMCAYVREVYAAVHVLVQRVCGRVGLEVRTVVASAGLDVLQPRQAQIMLKIEQLT